MGDSRFGKFDLKRLSRGGALCGAPIGGGMPTDMLGASAPGEVLSLALVLAGFLGAGVWMFRKWGKSSANSPEEAPEPQPEPGLATS